MKHSVVLFLSPIWTQDKSSEAQDNFVHKQYTNIIDGQEVDCIQTNESAVRYIQARLKEQEESISKIYILASKKVKEAKYFFYQGKECNWSHIDVFKRRLIDEIGMSEDQFEEIDYDENQTVDMNMNTLLELAIKLRKEHCADKDAMIHFDMTGGLRTVTQLLSSLLYLLKHSDIEVGYILYSDMAKQIVENASELFDINTLISGMEEFANYGSTRSLQAYFEKETSGVVTMSKECMELIDAMKAFSIAVSLCIPFEMVKAIKVLRDAIETFKQASYMSVKEEAFKYTINTVEKEYTTLLSNVNDDMKLKLSIIRWCIDKGLLQQALTLSTEWLASILFDTHIYYHKHLESIKGLLQNDVRKLKRSYEESFVMSYTKKDSTLPNKFSKEYKHKIDLSVPQNVIKFLRTNIGNVKSKRDIDELLQGLDIEESKIYKLIYQCIEAKRLLDRLVEKKRTPSRFGQRVLKEICHIKDITVFSEAFTEINSYLKNIHKKQEKLPQCPTYSRFLYNQSRTVGGMLQCIFMSFSEVAMLQEFPLPMKQDIVSQVAEDEYMRQSFDKGLLYYGMLKQGVAYTDLTQEESLQFIMEHHEIKDLRNTINHASEGISCISSKDIISKISRLVDSIEAKRWKGTLTVIERLEEYYGCSNL